MPIFLIIFFSIYGSMNAYFFWRFHQAYHLQGYRLLALIAFLILMITGPVLVRLMESAGLHFPATVLAYIAYLWMAVALWFLAFGLLMDIWNVAVRIAALAAPGAGRFIIGGTVGFRALIAIVALLMTWGFLEANQLRVERHSIQTSFLPAGSDPVVIAQISDVHLGLIEGRRRIERVIDILEGASVDLLLATGDLVDGIAPHLNHLSGLFAAYQPPLGKYAVTGNHEFYAGLESSLQFLRDSGFRVLRQETVDVGENLSIAGVDDPAGHFTGQGSRLNEESILPGKNRDRFVLLLKHQPVADPGSVGRFDLQLSGHTHKGQIFPFNYIVKMRYPLLAGWYDLAGGSTLYTSRGTGTWGPPLRVLASPEVTIITIEPED